jgi:NADH-quinone oxidoreductase subunit C
MAETEQIKDPIGAIKEKFKDRILDFYEKSDKRYYITIQKDDLLGFVDFIFNKIKARYQIISALDTPKGIEIVYHFALDKFGKVVSGIIILPHEDPKVESISPIVTGAQWIEREIAEIMGVTFLHHPDPRKFLLSDDWPEGVHPYRRKK